MAKKKDISYIQSLQARYVFKRWQMFTTIKRLVGELEKPEDANPDLAKILETCQSFIKEEQLVVRYS